MNSLFNHSFTKQSLGRNVIKFDEFFRNYSFSKSVWETNVIKFDMSDSCHDRLKKVNDTQSAYATMVLHCYMFMALDYLFETKTIDIIQQYITDQFDSTVKMLGDLGVLQKQIPTYNAPTQLGGQRLWCFSR